MTSPVHHLEDRSNPPDDEPLVSVVVAVRHTWSALPGLIEALRWQQLLGSLEVVVVNNNRRPHGEGRGLRVAALRHTGTNDHAVAIRVVHEPRAGLSRARNTGIRAARGRFVLITDPDARPAPQWAGEMVTALRSTGAYCVGGRVVPRYTDRTGRTAGVAPKLGPELAAMFTPPKWPHQVEPLGKGYWLVGCNLGMRRTPLPVFDERFGVRGRGKLTCEDLEFVERCQREGRSVVIAPAAVVHRAVNPGDLTLSGLLRRGFGHGRSMARLTALYPDLSVLDRYDLAHVATLWPADRTAALVAAARIAGRVLEQSPGTGRMANRGRRA